MADWYYATQGDQFGPIGLENLQSLVSTGRIIPTDLVWTEGMAQWQPAAEVPALREAFVSPPVGNSIPTIVAYQTPPLQKSQHATLALTGMIISLVSLVLGAFGVLTAIAGLVCGWIALRGMKRTGDRRNRGFAIAAVAVGAGYIALILIGITAVVLIFRLAK
jgi:hypothetical protein